MISIVKKVHEVHPVRQKPVPGRVRGHVLLEVHEVHPVRQKPVPGRVRGHVLLDVLPVLNALFMVTALKDFLDIVNEKGGLPDRLLPGTRR